MSICFAVVLLAATPSFAAGTTQVSMAVEGFDGHSRGARVKYAQEILVVVNALKSGLRLLTSSEVEWVSKEETEIELLSRPKPPLWMPADQGPVKSRYKKLWSTPEYNHRELEDELVGLSRVLGCILNSKVTLPKEMLCWSSLTWFNPDWETWIDATQRTGRLNLTALRNVMPNPTPKGVSEFMEKVSVLVANQIVMPYNQGDIFTR